MSDWAITLLAVLGFGLLVAAVIDVATDFYEWNKRRRDYD